jgi:hypothetical protein
METIINAILNADFASLRTLLADYSSKELRAIGKELGIKGASRGTKEFLTTSIVGVEAARRKAEKAEKQAKARAAKKASRKAKGEKNAKALREAREKVEAAQAAGGILGKVADVVAANMDKKAKGSKAPKPVATPEQSETPIGKMVREITTEAIGTAKEQTPAPKATVGAVYKVLNKPAVAACRRELAERYGIETKGVRARVVAKEVAKALVESGDALPEDIVTRLPKKARKASKGPKGPNRLDTVIGLLRQGSTIDDIAARLVELFPMRARVNRPTTQEDMIRFTRKMISDLRRGLWYRIAIDCGGCTIEYDETTNVYTMTAPAAIAA